MKKRNLLFAFIKYTSLNTVGMLGISCYILADTFFVSKALYANGLTALNLAIPVYSFINGAGLMLGMGGATKYAVAKSQKDENAANSIFTNTVYLTLFLSAIFMVLGVFLSGGIIRLFGADEAVFAMSNTYVKVIMLFSPMFMLNNVLLCFLRNDGAPKLVMAAMVGGSLSNILLDYIFMFPLKMGILGAVLATGIAPIISIAVLSGFFIRKKNGFRFAKCRFSLKISAGVLSIGFPSLITEMSAGVVMIIFNALILKLQGNVGVAAYGIIANLSLVVLSVYTGIAQGVQPLISSSFGKGDKNSVKAFFKYAIAAIIAVSIIIYAVVFFCASQLAGIFNSEKNEVLLNIAETGLRIYFLGGVFAGFNIITSIYFTATERARPAHIISLLRGFILIIPLSFLLSSIGGMIGVFSVFPTTEFIVSTLILIGYLVYKIGLRNKNAASLTIQS